MEDFVKKYEKNKWITRGTIVILALAIAFGIHFMLYGSENFSKYLKANVLQIADSEIKADIFLTSSQSNNNAISVASGSIMKDVEKVNLSLLFDPTHISISDFTTDIDGATIQVINNTEGVAQLQVDFTTPVTLEIKREILSLTVDRISNSPAQINLISTTFSDTDGNKYELSSSGLLF